MRNVPYLRQPYRSGNLLSLENVCVCVCVCVCARVCACARACARALAVEVVVRKLMGE